MISQETSLTELEVEQSAGMLLFFLQNENVEKNLLADFKVHQTAPPARLACCAEATRSPMRFLYTQSGG